MKYGYIRVSTRGQARDGTSLATQREQLVEAGVPEKRLYTDDGVSGANSSRPGLDSVRQRLESGDTLVVPCLSRLGRTMKDLMILVYELREEGIEVRFLREGFDTSTTGGRLLLGVFAAVAEMERETTLERTALGRERAAALGRVGGRPKKYDERTISRVRRMEQNRDLTVKERAAAIGIPVASYYVLRKRLGKEETAA